MHMYNLLGLTGHRAHTMVRWLNKGSNGVNAKDKAGILSILKALAYTTTGETTINSLITYIILLYLLYHD